MDNPSHTGAVVSPAGTALLGVTQLFNSGDAVLLEDFTFNPYVTSIYF